MKTTLARIAFAIALLVSGLFAFSAHEVTAGTNTGRLYINNLSCHKDASDYYAECHSHRLAGMDWALNTATRESDRNGTVSWGPGGGKTYRMTLEPREFYAYNGGYFYCENQTTGEAVVDQYYTDLDEPRCSAPVVAG